MRIIDQWTGGASRYTQFEYRLIENDDLSQILQYKALDHEEDFAPVVSGHRVAVKVAEILLEEDRLRNVVRLGDVKHA